MAGVWHAPRSLGMAGLQANTHVLRPMGPDHWHEDRLPAVIGGHFWHSACATYVTDIQVKVFIFSRPASMYEV